MPLQLPLRETATCTALAVLACAPETGRRLLVKGWTHSYDALEKFLRQAVIPTRV
jgi:hypothetical protein